MSKLRLVFSSEVEYSHEFDTTADKLESFVDGDAAAAAQIERRTNTSSSSPRRKRSRTEVFESLPVLIDSVAKEVEKLSSYLGLSDAEELSPEQFNQIRDIEATLHELIS